MFYLVMELVTGRTLDQVIKAEGVLKPERVVRIGMQVCDALDGAHALSIVHRDLKPANIMLLDRGRDLVKVLDFGLAKSLAHDSGADDDDERRRAARYAGVHAARARARRVVRWSRRSVLARLRAVPDRVWPPAVRVDVAARADRDARDTTRRRR